MAGEEGRGMRISERPIDAQELAELRALHLTLPRLRKKPWAEIAANPVVLGCLRNTLEAKRRAAAARAHQDPASFELQP